MPYYVKFITRQRYDIESMPYLLKIEKALIII